MKEGVNELQKAFCYLVTLVNDYEKVRTESKDDK